LVLAGGDPVCYPFEFAAQVLVDGGLNIPAVAVQEPAALTQVLDSREFLRT